MRTHTSGVLLAASLAAVATAQGPRTFDGFDPPASTQSPFAGLPGEGGGRLALDDGDLRARIAGVSQDPDYSMYGLFMQAHGDFVLKYKRFEPDVQVRGQLLPNGEIKGEQGDFDLARLTVDAKAPFMVSTDGYLVLGAYFDHRRYLVDNMPGFADESLFVGALQLGFGVFVDDNVLLEGMVMPGSWSDWDGTLHRRDFDCPASLLFTIRTTDDVFFKIGARYNEIYEDANVLPYLGLSWQIMDELRLDILAPEYIEMSWWPAPEFGVRIGAEIQGAEYRVRQRNAVGDREFADMRVQEVLAYGGATWRMSDYVSLAARAGMAVAGDYKLDDGLAATQRVDGTIRPTVFAEVTFGIDF